MSKLQESLDILLGERLVVPFDSQRYVDWAVEAMLAGYRSESLDILAGLDGEPTLVKEGYLNLAIHELGLEKSADEELILRQYAERLAVDIISGRLAPELGLDKLCAITRASDYPPEYYIFEELAEDIETLRDGYGPVFGNIRYLGEKDAVIVHTCSLFLSCPLPSDIVADERPKVDLSRAYCYRCRGRVDHAFVYRWKGWLPPRRRRMAVCANCGLEGVAVPGAWQ